MIEYYNDILAIEVKWLAGDRKSKRGQIMTYAQYVNLKRSKRLKHLQNGGNGRKALVEYDSLPDWIKEAIIAQIGKSPYDVQKYQYFKKYIIDDAEARHYYVTYTLPDGRFLPDKKRLEYYTNAILTNAIINYHNDVKGKRSAMRSNSGLWENLSTLINYFRPEYNHTLPKTSGSLRNKVNQYKKQGYDAFISGKFGNKNKQKINEQIEELVMSLYAMENKPYEDEVWEAYMEFITGKMSLFVKTGDRKGEIIDVEDFYDKNGEPILISKGTVRNILNKYRDIVDKKRNDWLYYNNIHRPHHHRHAATFSLSKLTLDDRDLPPLLTSGGHVKAYFVWDAMSEVILGVAYSTTKDELLFISAMQDAFRNLYNLGLGMPLEVEVEHHLVIKFKEQLETIFSFVRWGNPGNAQEKKAERLNKKFKYAHEKKQFPTGRFYAKLEANRPKVTKIWTDEGMTNKVDKYSFNQIVEIYNMMIDEYNNSKHSRFNKSKIEVLIENQNPKAQKLPMPVISKAFGFKTETKLRRSQYVQVARQNYQLPNPSYIRRIDRTKRLTAYYIPEADSTINQVYIYQFGNYIASCNLIDKYSEARSEWDNENNDEEKYLEQSKYLAKFDKNQKEETKRILNIEVMPEIEQEFEECLVEELEVATVNQDDEDNWDDILTNKIDWAKNAANSI